MQNQLKTWLARLIVCALLTAMTSFPAMAAIAFVQDIGQDELYAGGSTTSLGVSATTNVRAGDVIVLEVVFSGSTNGLSPSVSDSGANTYTFIGGTGSVAGTLQTYLYVAPVTTALHPGDAITVSFVTNLPNAYNVAISAQEFSGVSTDLDDYTPDVLNAGGTTTNFSTGPLVTANANDLLLAYVAIGSTAGTAVNQTTSPTFTQAIPYLDVGAHITFFSSYSIVSTTSSYVYAGNFDLVAGNSPPPFAVGIYALKAAAVAPPPISVTVAAPALSPFNLYGLVLLFAATAWLALHKVANRMRSIYQLVDRG